MSSKASLGPFSQGWRAAAAAAAAFAAATGAPAGATGGGAAWVTLYFKLFMDSGRGPKGAEKPGRAMSHNQVQALSWFLVLLACLCSWISGSSSSL